MTCTENESIQLPSLLLNFSHLSNNQDWRFLPDSFLEKVFLHLNWKDRFHCSLVCQSWSEIFYFPCLWRDLCLLPDNVFVEDNDDDDDDNSADIYYHSTTTSSQPQPHHANMEFEIEPPTSTRRGNMPLLKHRLDYDKLAWRTYQCLRAIGHCVHRMWVPATRNYYLLHRCLTTFTTFLQNCIEYQEENVWMFPLQLQSFQFTFYSDWDAEKIYGTGGPLLSTLETMMKLLLRCTAHHLLELKVNRLLLSLTDAQRFMQLLVDSLNMASELKLDENGDDQLLSTATDKSSLLTLSFINLTQCVWRPDPLLKLPSIWSNRLYSLELSPPNVSAHFLLQLVNKTTCQVLIVSQDEFTQTDMHTWTDIDPLVWNEITQIRPEFKLHCRLHVILCTQLRPEMALLTADLALPNSVAPLKEIIYRRSPFSMNLERCLMWSDFSHSLTTLVFEDSIVELSSVQQQQSIDDHLCDYGLRMLLNMCPLLQTVVLSCPICVDTVWAMLHLWRGTKQEQLPPLSKLLISQRSLQGNRMHWREGDLQITNEEFIEMQKLCQNVKNLEENLGEFINCENWHFLSSEEFHHAIQKF